MRGQVLAVSALSAALLMATMAAPASAQGYSSYHDEHVAQSQDCSVARHDNAVGGAILGALLGAAVGSHVAANHHRSDGALVGAGAGALMGGAIGNNSRSRACENGVQGQYDPYYGQPQQQGYYQQDPRYGRDDRLAGGPYDRGYDRSGYDDRRYDRRRRDDCRWGQILTRDPDGYEVRENVWMCRGRDGAWRPMEG